MDGGKRKRRPGKQHRSLADAWYWCARCAQRWQLEPIPQLQTEGCPLCGGEVVPMLGHHRHREDEPDR